MRYIIYGAGAVGGAIGARLSLADHEVILIARGTHYEAIRSDGLIYRSPGESRKLELPVVNHPDLIDFQADDVVFLTMKSQHTQAALEDLQQTAPSNIPIVCCQNGVANEFIAARKFINVYAMVVLLPASHLKPGEVWHHAVDVGGILDAGCFHEGVDHRIRQITTHLTEAGYSANADPEPMKWKYAKLLQNLGNSLQAVADVGREARDLRSTLIHEALDCYRAAGIKSATRDEVHERHKNLVKTGEIDGVTREGGSSWQSLVRGTGDIEADYLNGEICMLGKIHGVPTPANETLRDLANQVAREKTPPGQYSVDQIRALIDTHS